MARFSIDHMNIMYCFRTCIASQVLKESMYISNKTMNEDRLTTAVEMLDGQIVKLERSVLAETKMARERVLAGDRSSAMNHLKNAKVLKRRTMTARSMQFNLQNMKNEIEDSKVYQYGISAMSDVAKQYNFSSANLDKMYKQVTDAQDRLQEFHDQNNEISTIISERLDLGSGPIDDDHLEQELNQMLSEANLESSLSPSTPAAAAAAAAGLGASTSLLKEDFPPVPATMALTPMPAAQQMTRSEGKLSRAQEIRAEFITS